MLVLAKLVILNDCPPSVSVGVRLGRDEQVGSSVLFADRNQHGGARQESSGRWEYLGQNLR